MPVYASQVKKTICVGIFKVLYYNNLKWNDLRHQEISLLFQGVANPTSWSTFFVEAIATAIQQELVMRGSFCPGLEKKLVEYESDTKTWEDLETFIKANVRSTQVVF